MDYEEPKYTTSMFKSLQYIDIFESLPMILGTCYNITMY